jgi:hypothetical protein
VRNRLEAAYCVKASGELVRERLVLDKAIGVCRADGLFVQALCIELAAFDASDLGAHQRDTAFEIFRAILRPDFDLSVVGGHRLAVLSVPIGECRIAGCRVGQRSIEVILRRFKK